MNFYIDLCRYLLSLKGSENYSEEDKRSSVRKLVINEESIKLSKKMLSSWYVCHVKLIFK